MNGLLHLIDKGIKTLDRNMDGEDVPPSTQVRPAQIVIEQAVQQHQLEDATARLVELEETGKEIKG